MKEKSAPKKTRNTTSAPKYPDRSHLREKQKTLRIDRPTNKVGIKRTVRSRVFRPVAPGEHRNRKIHPVMIRERVTGKEWRLRRYGVRQFISDRNVKQHIRYRKDTHRPIRLPCEIGVIKWQKCQ